MYRSVAVKNMLCTVVLPTHIRRRTNKRICWTDTMTTCRPSLCRALTDHGRRQLRTDWAARWLLRSPTPARRRRPPVLYARNNIIILIYVKKLKKKKNYVTHVYLKKKKNAVSPVALVHIILLPCLSAL